MNDDDEPEVTITAEKYKLHASEKVSTDDYENAQVNMTIEGSIDGAEIDGSGLPYDVRGRLLRMTKQMQKDVEKAGENRNKLPEAEDWSVD